MTKGRVYSPLSFFLGARYVQTRHGHGFSSFISASSTLGIAIGVMVLILVLSAMNGFERELANRLLSMIPHGEFTAVEQPIDNWRKQIKILEQDPHVIKAAPVTKLTGMVQHKDNIKALEIRGVDLHKELEISSIGNYLSVDNWFKLEQSNSLVIGAGIANKLKVAQGDIVQLLLPRNNQGDKFLAPIKHNVTVVGVFKFGGSVDSNLAFMSLANAGAMLDIGDAVQGIRISVDDVFQAAPITRRMANQLQSYVYISNWTRTQGHLFNDIQLVRLVMFIVLVLVIAVASFNIVSTLIMAVNDRKGDIATLKTMGAANSTIMLTFIYQGLFNGVVGTISGGVAGVALALNLTGIIRAIEQFFKISFLSGDVYFVDFMPTQLRASDVLITVCTALILTILATLYPAWRATKIEPAKVLGGI